MKFNIEFRRNVQLTIEPKVLSFISSNLNYLSFCLTLLAWIQPQNPRQSTLYLLCVLYKIHIAFGQLFNIVYQEVLRLEDVLQDHPAHHFDCRQVVHKVFKNVLVYLLCWQYVCVGISAFISAQSSRKTLIQFCICMIILFSSPQNLLQLWVA